MSGNSKRSLQINHERTTLRTPASCSKGANCMAVRLNVGVLSCTGTSLVQSDDHFKERPLFVVIGWLEVPPLSILSLSA